MRREKERREKGKGTKENAVKMSGWDMHGRMEIRKEKWRQRKRR